MSLRDYDLYLEAYEYRRKYNEYRSVRMQEERNLKGQMSLFGGKEV